MVDVEMIRDFGGGRRATQPLRQLPAGLNQLSLKVFQTAGNFDRPAVIAAAYFAHHGRHGVSPSVSSAAVATFHVRPS